MRKFGWLSLMLSVGFAVGCGDSTSNPTPTDDAAVNDTPVNDTQTPTDVRDSGDVRTDVATDAGTSRAGAACTMPNPMGGMDPACGDGDLRCVDTQSSPMCTLPCENNASQTNERSQCGGNGSTCLTEGDPPMRATDPTPISFCTQSCRPTGTTPATGACRAGFVCTGWWFTHAGATPDSTGCFGHCDADSQCPSGMHCNAHLGTCDATGTDMTRLPDGAPCNPQMRVTVPGEAQPRNIQCRGICFLMSSTAPTQGICGSLLNLRASTMCHDDPDNVAPRAPQGNTDNLAVCIWRTCAVNSDCRSPHICRFPEQSGMIVTEAEPQCDYPTAMQRTGIVGDGGAPTDAPTDSPTDAPATDIPVTDVPATDVPATDVPATDVPATDVGTDSATAPTDAGTDAATATDGGAAG